MNVDFRAELDALAAKVLRNPLLELLEFRTGSPLPKESIDVAEQRFGAPLPASLRQLYGSVDGATLRWRFRPDLDERTRGRVNEEFATAVTRHDIFNVAGAVDILSLEHMLFDEEYRLPQSEPDEGEFEFDEVVYSNNKFCGMLRLFDVVDDYFAMAFVPQPGRSDWQMIWLSDHWIEYDFSRVTYLEDYLRYVVATWGLVNARDELFGEYRGDRRKPLRYDPGIGAARVPAILHGGGEQDISAPQ
jgi:hypothetical protein